MDWTHGMLQREEKSLEIFGRIKNLKEIDHLQDRRIILKSVLKQYDRGELYDFSCSEY
jgi:hypothetical protein